MTPHVMMSDAKVWAISAKVATEALRPREPREVEERRRDGGGDQQPRHLTERVRRQDDAPLEARAEVPVRRGEGTAWPPCR